jgi:glucose/arabinose dehydrogenase
MRLRAIVLSLVMALVALAGCFDDEAESQGTSTPATPGNPGLTSPPSLGFEAAAGGLERPVHITHAGDGSGRLFVVEQAGRVLVFENGSLRDEPYLDIRDQVGSSGYEQGLLSIAFHPDFPQRPDVFIDYTDTDGDTVVARLHPMTDDPSRLDASGQEVLLTVDQPAANHNGGLLAFGPDGYLYIGLGDGGLRNDAFGNAQNRATLLGSILRIDVAPVQGYAIPPDNPYQGGPEREEIWAWGLRNPWRFSFDRQTGDLYIADVGQDALEEVNVQPAASGGGENYGWPVYEASASLLPSVNLLDVVFPVAEYAIGDTGHCSVTGGFVYRGQDVPGLVGHYLFGDFCSGTLWAIQNDSDQWRMSELEDTDFSISTFGEDEAGELYVADHARGQILRVVPG